MMMMIMMRIMLIIMAITDDDDDDDDVYDECLTTAINGSKRLPTADTLSTRLLEKENTIHDRKFCLSTLE